MIEERKKRAYAEERTHKEIFFHVPAWWALVSMATTQMNGKNGAAPPPRTQNQSTNLFFFTSGGRRERVKRRKPCNYSGQLPQGEQQSAHQSPRARSISRYMNFDRICCGAHMTQVWNEIGGREERWCHASPVQRLWINNIKISGSFNSFHTPRSQRLARNKVSVALGGQPGAQTLLGRGIQWSRRRQAIMLLACGSALYMVGSELCWGHWEQRPVNFPLSLSVHKAANANWRCVTHSKNNVYLQNCLHVCSLQHCN